MSRAKAAPNRTPGRRSLLGSRSPGPTTHGPPSGSRTFAPSNEPPRSLDFAILCERYRDAPGGVGFDPRKSPELIARRLSVSPATVRRRLTEWRGSGFFRGYDVLPHPELLGGRWVARLLEFHDPIDQETALGSLELIDGVIQIVPSRNLLMVVYFVDSAALADRRLRQLRKIVGAREIGPEMPFLLPACPRRMTRPDWRLLRTLRRTPEAKLSVLAAEVGQSPRTTSRRLDALLDAGAIMFDPILDFSRFSQTIAVLVAYLSSPESSGEVERQIRGLFPQSEQSGGPVPVGPDGRAGAIMFRVCVRTAAELDSLVAPVARIPGVDHVLLWSERSSLPVREWLDERIETELRTPD